MKEAQSNDHASSRTVRATFTAHGSHDPNKTIYKIQYDIYPNNADNINEKLAHGLLNFGVLLESVDVERYDYIRLQKKNVGVL